MDNTVGPLKETSYADYDVQYGAKPMSRESYHQGTIHTEGTDSDAVFKDCVSRMGGSASDFSVKPGAEGDK